MIKLDLDSLEHIVKLECFFTVISEACKELSQNPQADIDELRKWVLFIAERSVPEPWEESAETRAAQLRASLSRAEFALLYGIYPHQLQRKGDVDQYIAACTAAFEEWQEDMQFLKNLME